MNFPKDNHKLNKIFRKAEVPEVSELKGEFFVDMLTGLPSLRKFSHRKFFYPENGKVSGYNSIFTDKKWGHFFLEEGICKELDSLKVLVINYNREENSFISKKIRDYIKRIDEGNLYLGRLNYLFMGKIYFLGYFSLAKKK